MANEQKVPSVVARKDIGKLDCRDYHWLDDASVESPALFAAHTLHTSAVTMPDGVRIAVDVYLPSKPVNGPLPKSFPTMMHFTRYFRNWRYGSCAVPCGCMFCCCCCGLLSSKLKMPGPLGGDHWNMRSVIFAEKFVPRGFAWVSIDVRGTGASGGGRPHDLQPVEIEDQIHLVKWLVQQPWCNGSIGSTGISYDGLQGMFLASHTQLKSVRAIAPLFTPVDLYSELTHPGGLRCIGFIKAYSDFTYNLERNTPENCKFPFLVGCIVKSMLNGVRPVAGDEDLAAALAQHADNWNIADVHATVLNRDDRAVLGKDKDIHMRVDDISVHTHLASVLESPAAMLAVSGWYDSGSAWGAVRVFLGAQARGKSPALLLGTQQCNKCSMYDGVLWYTGPWNHGARNNCSPNASTHVPSFPLVQHLVRFFEEQLCDAKSKGNDSAFSTGVHYYTVNQERWKSSSTWPPEHSWRAFTAAENSSLTAIDASISDQQLMALKVDPASDKELKQDHTAGADDYTVRPHTTGLDSRWNLVQHMFKRPIVYPQRTTQDEALLVFDSPPLASAMEVTGHAVLDLHLSCDHEDASVFVYVEEVDVDGHVTYVTEGQLRLAHRALGLAKSPYVDCAPYRSFETQHMAMGSGSLDVPHRLVVLLQPVSFLLRKGSCLRLAIGGLDTDNFEPLAGYNAANPPRFRVWRTAQCMTTLHLPVVESV